MKAGWTEVALAEVAEVRLGRQRSPNNHNGTHMRPYVRAANVGWDGLRLDDVKKMNFTDAEMSTYQLVPGDLLLSEASGSALEVGKPAMWTGEIEGCGFQNTLLRVRSSGPDPGYLLHFFRYQAVSGGFARRSRGVGIFHLGRKALAELLIPLPPLDEQRRIAAILDKADELRSKRRTAIAQLDSLTQAIFTGMFGYGSRFSFFALGEVFSEKPIFGTMVPPGTEGDWLDLRVGNIQNGRIDLRDRKYVQLEGAMAGRHSLRAGDLLLARAIASQSHLGKCIVVDPGDQLWAFDSHLMRLRLDQPTIRPEFLCHWLRSPRGRRDFLASSRQSAVQFNINTKEIAALEVPVPPIELQSRFQAALGSIEAEEKRGKQSLDLLDSMTSSLQTRAFRGEL